MIIFVFLYIYYLLSVLLCVKSTFKLKQASVFHSHLYESELVFMTFPLKSGWVINYNLALPT